MVARAATLVLVPLLSIIGHEIWEITGHLRYKSSPPDPTKTMRAVVFSKHGSAKDVLRIVDKHPQPLFPASPNMLIVKVIGAALNPVDFKMRRNPQPDVLIPKPKIPGYDVSGVVVSAGAGSHGFKIGDHVYGMLPIIGNPWGSLAEYVVADASIFAKAPTSIPLVDAAALPLVGLTVMQVFDAAGYVAPPPVMVRSQPSSSSSADSAAPSKSALVQAASGGVGSFAVQYLRHVLGFEHVLGTTSAANAARVTELGATKTIDYRHERFEAVADEMGGVDVVIDPMAWSYMERTISDGAQGGGRTLRAGGKYCHIMSTDWAPSGTELDPLTAFVGPIKKWQSRLMRLIRRDAPQVFSSAVQPDGARLATLAGHVDAGHIRPNIDVYYDGLERVVEAFEYLETGHAKGKVVVRVADT